MIHSVMMDQRRAPAAFSAKTVGQHLDNAVEFYPGEVSIRPGSARELEQFGFIPIVSRARSHNLLRQNIERLFRNKQAIQFAAPDRSQQGGDFNKLIPSQRKDSALR